MPDYGDVLARLEDERVTAHLLSKLKFAQNTARTALADEFDKIGLTTPQFLALAAISQGEELSSAELARRSFCTPQAMIAIVARLEAAGLIRRARATRGGRSLATSLTPKGEAMLNRARAHAYAIERYILDVLGPEQYDVMLNGLDRITEGLSQSGTVTKRAPWDRYVEEHPEPARERARG